ncbi:SET domain containing protein [Tritrichomonas foetus]|uniref:[histone H3]-lysine(4) N-trimethyltransferase n=1 Tax=Tritrichomonas foetus TaxID=1144522 RepID=A0A1J4KBN3_9EUKA|nr:SET domain containing protein [Tritrichomonas foetus]|eukprot:OHT07100.1 SET domain containing protein [Tritrichomonas foetus]
MSEKKNRQPSTDFSSRDESRHEPREIYDYRGQQPRQYYQDAPRYSHYREYDSPTSGRMVSSGSSKYIDPPYRSSGSSLSRDSRGYRYSDERYSYSSRHSDIPIFSDYRTGSSSNIDREKEVIFEDRRSQRHSSSSSIRDSLDPIRSLDSESRLRRPNSVDFDDDLKNKDSKKKSEKEIPSEKKKEQLKPKEQLIEKPKSHSKDYRNDYDDYGKEYSSKDYIKDYRKESYRNDDKDYRREYHEKDYYEKDYYEKDYYEKDYYDKEYRDSKYLSSRRKYSDDDRRSPYDDDYGKHRHRSSSRSDSVDRIDSEYPVEITRMQRSPSVPHGNIPPALIKPVTIQPPIFAPKCMEMKNEGNALVEVTAPHYILDHYIRKMLEYSGKIVRYARLSYCAVFAKFVTHTMAEHAIARLNRRKMIIKRDGNYSYQLADKKKIDQMILLRKEAEESICDPPVCLLLHNAYMHQDKIPGYLEPFDKITFEYYPNEKLLFTYHKNMASVNDFLIAFGPQHMSGFVNSYVTRVVNKEWLKTNVLKIITSKLIEECMKDCSELLIPDLYVPVLRRERIKQRIMLPAPKRFGNSNSFGVNFYASKTIINFYLSPSRKVQTLRKKVKTATRERKTEMIKKDSRKYQKKVEQEIQQKEEHNQFDKLEQPPLQNSSSRLTPIHKIDESIKRKYLRACAEARRQPFIVARDSGLTLCQSQFPNAVEQQRRQKLFMRQTTNNFKSTTGIVGKRVYFDKSAIQGWGLFALEPISADSFICEYTGDMIRSRVADLREKKYENQGLPHMYLFRIDEEYVVDATVKGGKARFLNHSCHPNCRSKIINISGTQTISFYALKNIKPHDEITFNYQMEFEEDKTKWEKCYCGSKNCLGYLNYCEDPEIRKQRDLMMYNEDSD